MLNHALDLPKLSHIAPSIERLVDIDRYGKSDFIRLMGYITGNHVVAATPKYGDQPCPYRAQSSGY
jgi:hypothetical protein